ncbi:uncharacterized protein G2W53_030049 [Senna tora]|uniref:Uncharacterized protein n=1 Tax=Senna tora TaxID=362788 RepID=A0A834WAD0_9FABA|nr:uncharacterized protein G2W53_030049 [Senna tora]
MAFAPLLPLNSLVLVFDPRYGESFSLVLVLRTPHGNPDIYLQIFKKNI